jgi:hypothetical protein
MEFVIQRQGVEYLFGDTLPTTTAQRLHKLKKANGLTARGTYNAKKARPFKSPRILGEALASQMDHNTS